MRSKKKYGQKIEVHVPTHITASLEFASGVLGTFMNSYDIRGGHHLPWIEIYGTEGTLVAPNPNAFGGEPHVRRTAEPDAGWQAVPLSRGYTGTSRGIGAADLAAAVFQDRPHRANADLAYHILEVCNAIYTAGESGRTVAVASTIERPLPFPDGLTADIEE